MSEMVERVAKAICRVDLGGQGDDKWDTYEDCARAAIAAMREPTEDMKDACCQYGWQAMIDAALKPVDHEDRK